MGNNVSFSYTQKTGASEITAAEKQYIRTSSEVKGESENVCCDNEFIASGKKEEYNKISMSSDSNKSHDVSMQDNNLEGATAYVHDHSSVLLENMEQNHSESRQGFKTKSQTCENIKPNLDMISSATANSKQTVCLQLPSKPVVKAKPLCLPSFQKDTKSKSATVPVKSKKSVKQLDFNNHVTDGQPSEIVVFSNNVQEEVSNEALLELADLQLKNGNQHEAKTNIAHILTRLDQKFNLMRTSKRVDQSQNMLDGHSKNIGKQYKMCSLLLMKLPDSVLDAMRCLYTGLVYYGNPELYEYEKISSDIWRRFQEEVVNNFKAAYQEMADLVFICNNLYERHTRIILFIAFELTTKFVKLMSKLPEDSKLNIYTLIPRLWLICARCHYIVKEFSKAQEVLQLLCKDQRQCNNIDVLELWAFCLLHTEKYTLAKQKVELAIEVARTEEQKSRFQKLEEHLIQKIQQRNKDNKHDENGDFGNTLTESSGYSYGQLIDLVESANIDFEAEVDDDVGNEWSDTQSIADSEYSALSDASSNDDTASSGSTRSRRNKIRRKTKTLRRKKGILTDQSSSSQISGTLPLPSFTVSPSSKFDMIQKWRNDSRQALRSHHYLKGHNKSGKDFIMNEEMRFSEEENLSENMSDISSMTSCTTMSMAGLSADEFSGSEYDVSDSGSDWCGSASDFEKEEDNIEEKSLEEPTYFQRSLSYHSGQFRARNILEKNIFRKV